MLRALSKAGLGALALTLILASPGFAQESVEDLKKEIDALKAGQQTILKQLEELRKLVQASNRPPARGGPAVEGVVFDLDGNIARGKDSAKLTMIEFTDYQ